MLTNANDKQKATKNRECLDFIGLSRWFAVLSEC